MADTPSPTCPNCGAPLPEGSSPDACPKCLMDNAAWSQTQADPGSASLAPTVPGQTTGSVPPDLPDLPGPGADFGDYRIVHLLGRGGMGAVYEAEHVETGRRVALKVLSHKLDSDDARKRFIREGRLAASINHPNSVYVFGTEEIEGTPTISMEIVPGGTLQEKVAAGGPMRPAEAVDAVMQIVAGLEAAQSIGILHRDVKPSNCFVDDQGTTKIGDFGLSISTEARGDSHLTVQGALLGTPAFSSPEQLRGDELNARSDMYSVGATLFYLLTGHAPFEEGNMVKLLSRVLEEQPSDPRSLNPDIPRGLARVVLRCLAKTPTDRFKSYADLEKALQPYSSESPTPGTLALRFGAYMLDGMVLVGGVGFFVQWAAWGSLGEFFSPENIGTPKYYLINAIISALTLAYFTVADGCFGTTVGKRLLRLRAVDTSGQTPGIPRAFARITVLMVVISLPFWGVVVANPELLKGEASHVGNWIVGVANLITIGLLFFRARRHNGYAGLHGFLTGTRIVRSPKTERRPRLAPVTSPSSPPAEGADRIGPYHIIEPLSDKTGDAWFLAFDTRLLRRIWLHDLPAGTPEVPLAQRNLTRPGRLRWITGKRSPEENWDAYEALDGKPLTTLLEERTRWAAARFWLLDLATELHAATADGSLPDTFAEDRVWVTAEGHAKLLDFPAPGTAPADTTKATPAEFVASVAARAVATASTPPPLHTGEIAAPPAGTTLVTLLDKLRNAVRRPAQVSRLRRLGLTLSVSTFPALGLAFAMMYMAITGELRDTHPKLVDLSSVTIAAMASEEGSNDRENLRRYIAHHFRDLVEDPETWKSWQTSMTIDPRRREIAKRAVADYPEVTPEQLTRAEEAAASALENNLGALELPAESYIVILMTTWLIYAAFPSFAMALIGRRGLLQLIFGTVVADHDGTRTNRIGCAIRSFIAWAPFGVAGAGTAIYFGVVGEPTTNQTIIASVLTTVFLIACCVLTHLPKERSLHDRFARTWLVPK